MNWLILAETYILPDRRSSLWVDIVPPASPIFATHPYGHLAGAKIAGSGCSDFGYNFHQYRIDSNHERTDGSFA